MKSIIMVCFLCVCSLQMNGQQEIILTKYSFNEMFFNPAFAGSTGEDKGSLTLQYRNQWLGIEGAPKTILVGGEYSFFDHKLGLGLSIGHEKIGINSNTEASLNTAYRINLGEGYLSGGIRTGFSSLYSDFTMLNISDSGDIFSLGSERISTFSVGAGILFHQDAIKVGFSLPNMVFISEGSVERRRHFYGHMEAKIGDEYSTILWQPNLLVKYEKSVPLQLTLGVQAWFKNRFAPGLHYRVGESVALSFEIAINDRFSFTSAYDFTANDLHVYTTGSFELMMSYTFDKQSFN